MSAPRVLLLLVPALVLGGLAVFERQAAFDGNPPALFATLLFALVVLTAGLGVAAYAIGRARLGSLAELQFGVELIATVNPGHRLAPREGGDVRALAVEINRLGDGLRDARSALEAEAARATAEVEAEREKLSRVLETLGEGVVLAAVAGRISLVNRAARELLGRAALGRSLFDFVDREKVAHFLERSRVGAGPAERFTLHPPGGAVLEAVMAPFGDRDGQLLGFVLVLRDVTAAVRADDERRRRLADALRDLSNPLASIRSLSESLLEGPGPEAEPGRPLLAAIHAEALRLSALVRETSQSASFGLARAPDRFEQITVADLIRIVRRRFEQQGGGAAAELSAEGFAPDETRVGAELSSLSAALAYLLDAVQARPESGAAARLRPLLRGGMLQLEIGAAGAAAVADLEPLLDCPILTSAGQPSVRQIAHHHAGETWAFAADGRFGFMLTLPTLEAP